MREVVVTISGFQTSEDGQDDVEVVQVGTYYERMGTRYILFEEHLEGAEQPVKNIIKMKPRCLEVQKHGAVETTLVFEEGKTRSSTYHVPYGSFLVDVKTTGVQIRCGEALLEASASYELSLNGKYCTDNQICVRVEPREGFQLYAPESV